MLPIGIDLLPKGIKTMSSTPTSQGVSLYPEDLQLLEEVANDLGLRGKKRRSPALQYILRQYRQWRDRQLALHPEENLNRQITVSRGHEPFEN